MVNKFLECAVCGGQQLTMGGLKVVHESIENGQCELSWLFYPDKRTYTKGSARDMGEAVSALSVLVWCHDCMASTEVVIIGHPNPAVQVTERKLLADMNHDNRH